MTGYIIALCENKIRKYFINCEESEELDLAGAFFSKNVYDNIIYNEMYKYIYI